MLNHDTFMEIMCVKKRREEKVNLFKQAFLPQQKLYKHPLQNDIKKCIYLVQCAGSYQTEWDPSEQDEKQSNCQLPLAAGFMTRDTEHVLYGQRRGTSCYI